MICIKCSTTDTHVTNSRPRKKTPSVWRRRKCTACGNVFTTVELPDYSSIQIMARDGAKEPYNLGRLIISIASAFGHAPTTGAAVAYDLAITVTQQIISSPEAFTALKSKNIAIVTYKTLARYDAKAALQYGITHDLIGSNGKLIA